MPHTPDQPSRVALVTGGTEGIGKAIALRLLVSGASVAVTGRREEKGRELLEEAGHPDRLVFLASDALAPGEPARVTTEVAQTLGPIEILVNNVGGGTGEYGRIDTLDPDAFRRNFDLNVMTSVAMTHAVLPQMVDGGWGRILMVASVEGKLPTPPGIGPYVAAKHALIGLAKSIAFDCGELGITCNTLCPGYVEIPSRVRTQSSSAGRSNTGRYSNPQENYKLLTRTRPARHFGRGRTRRDEPAGRGCRRDHRNHLERRRRFFAILRPGRVSIRAAGKQGADLAWPLPRVEF